MRGRLTNPFSWAGDTVRDISPGNQSHAQVGRRGLSPPVESPPLSALERDFSFSLSTGDFSFSLSTLNHYFF